MALEEEELSFIVILQLTAYLIQSFCYLENCVSRILGQGSECIINHLVLVHVVVIYSLNCYGTFRLLTAQHSFSKGHFNFVFVEG